MPIPPSITPRSGAELHAGSDSCMPAADLVPASQVSTADTIQETVEDNEKARQAYQSAKSISSLSTSQPSRQVEKSQAYLANRSKTSDTIASKSVPKFSSERSAFQEKCARKKMRSQVTFPSMEFCLSRTPQTELELFHGIKRVVEILMFDPRYHEKEVKFSRDSWLQVLFTFRGRAVLGLPFYLINAECALVVGLVHGTRGQVNQAALEVIRNLPSTPLKLMGAGLLFLVIFHTQSAYQKWAFARNVWHNISTASRDLALQSTAYIKDFALASRMCRYVVVFVVSVRFWVRSEELNPEILAPILTPAGLEHMMDMLRNSDDDDDDAFDDPELSFQFRQTCGPLAVLDVLWGILGEAVEEKEIGPFHGLLDGSIKALGSGLANAEKVLDTDIPFAYLAHVRTSVMFYLFLMPFFLVKDLGWFTIVTVFFFSYVAIGLENLAAEIETPFGYDENDLPLDQYCSSIARDIRDIIQRRFNKEESSSAIKKTHSELAKRAGESTVSMGDAADEDTGDAVCNDDSVAVDAV